MTPMEYRISYASCAGVYHLESEIPCQDKIALCREGDVFCVALADGAGSRASSELGADCVTRCTAELLRRRFDGLWDMGDRLAGYVLDVCVDALAQLGPPLPDLASTLQFFAGYKDGRYIAGHLGDGIQISVRDGEPEVFSTPENGAYQNETFFVTGEDALAHFRVRLGQLDGPGALLLMSDGMADVLYQRSTGIPASACRTIARWLQKGGDEDTVSQALTSNMQEVFSKYSNDDLSLAVIAWE